MAESTQLVSELPTLIFGDPHGNFDSVREFCSYYDKPGTVLLLGDQCLTQPLYTELSDVISRGWVIRWIHGNHDTDTVEYYRNLTDHEGSLQGHVSLINGVRVAGLGGVCRGTIWDGVSKPKFESRQQFLTSLPHNQRWMKGLPLTHRSTIFWSDFIDMSGLRADVLVCHESPSTHLFGLKFIDQLALKMGCKLIIHGHHHHSYRATLSSGIKVRGLNIGEVFKLEPNFCNT